MKTKNQEIMALVHTSRDGGGYAFQYTKILPENDPSFGNPVYITRDGYAPENMLDVLKERETLKEEISKLKGENERIYKDLAHTRADLSVYLRKKWYQFWK